MTKSSSTDEVVARFIAIEAWLPP